MKTTFKVIASVFALGFTILAGVHLFLQHGLTKAMREIVLPRLKEETGVDVHVDRLSIDVPNGYLFLKGVAVRNPEGFLFEDLISVQRIKLEVDISSLLRAKPVRVRNVSIENALINVVCNEDGEFNLNQLLEDTAYTAASSESGRTEPAQGHVMQEQEHGVGRPPPDRATLVSVPEVIIDALQGKARLRYVDLRSNRMDITLDLNMVGQGLSTQMDTAGPWGEMTLTGSQGNDRNLFSTDLRFRIAPIVDLQSLSFDLTGRLLEIDPRILDEIARPYGIRSAPFGLTPLLHCREGSFENSKIALNLQDIKLEDRVSGQLSSLGSIDSLRLVVPVKGTLQEPAVDVQSALMAAVGVNSNSLLGSFLNGSAEK